MVERAEIDQMAKFIAAMNGTSAEVPVTAATPTVPRPVGDPAIAEMKTILERFHSATDNVIAEAAYDRNLREAMITEPTEHGARIGSWEIKVSGDGSRKLYDVVHAESGEALASDLMLYEAAHGLARILNNGGRINSREAIELLQTEQDYAGSVHDMVLFKHRITKNTNSPRLHIFEARYGDAKRRALTARSRVVELSQR